MQMQTRTQYPNLREYVGPNLNRLSDARLESVLAAGGIEAEIADGFFDDLGKVARSVGKVALQAAPAVLPVAGTILGGAIGGPIGAQLGGSLARAAVGAIAPSPGAAAPSLPFVGGSAGQLLQTITRPETLRGLASMVL